ncbi:MAG: YhcH/YjgK/YiaL family protein [Faecalibacterium prausnitzii]
MIYDTLNNLPNYLGMSDNLDAVIEFVMARDINNLPAGKTRINGDKAVVTVSTVTPQTSDKALFQRRDAHLTLETDLEGSELFEVSLGELTPTRPTDEAADLTVGTAGTSIAGMLCEGRFALYLAGEPYKSGLKAQGCGKLKKAVFSIELDEDEEASLSICFKSKAPRRRRLRGACLLWYPWTERNNHKGEFLWILTSPALPSGSCGKPNT